MPRTLAQNADYIANTIKPAIKSAIEAQGVTVSASDSFLDYATRISEIEGGGGGSTTLYELYDYIQSDGTQVIDLGSVKNGDTVTVSNYMLSTITQDAWIWGVTDSSAFLGVVQNRNGNKSIYNNATGGSTTSYIRDQQNIDTGIASRNYTSPLCVFGFNLDGTYYPGIITRIYSVKVNDDFYVPARRKSDGVFGLYDVTNEAFLTDVAGGNAFTAGSKIMDIYS